MHAKSALAATLMTQSPTTQTMKDRTGMAGLELVFKWWVLTLMGRMRAMSRVRAMSKRAPSLSDQPNRAHHVPRGAHIGVWALCFVLSSSLTWLMGVRVVTGDPLSRVTSLAGPDVCTAQGAQVGGWVVCFVLSCWVICLKELRVVIGDSSSLSDQSRRSHRMPRVHRSRCGRCALFWSL
jgi:hypothetical protein